MEKADINIEELRDKLNYLISTHADYAKILEVSKRLDKLITLYYNGAGIAV